MMSFRFKHAVYKQLGAYEARDTIAVGRWVLLFISLSELNMESTQKIQLNFYISKDGYCSIWRIKVFHIFLFWNTVSRSDPVS